MDLPVRNPHLKLLQDNPSPFIQPFLHLSLSGDKAKELAPGSLGFFIDVAGEIEKYINRNNKPTKRLIALCRTIAKSGAVVTGFDRYEGSAGPNVILRNGALFYRMEAIEYIDPKVFAYEYRKPEYRGRPKT